MNRLFCLLCLAATAAALVGSHAGCSRQHYRMKADREVYSVLREGNNDPRWQIDDYRINPAPDSRMFLPFHPDKEPMPPDDPAAHQKMHRVAGMKGSRHWYDNGRTQTIENPRWRQSLMLNDRGEIPLDRDKAVELARLHSPEYQAALENLYLSAMAVSLQRFQHDVQFSGFGSLAYSKSAGSTDTLANRATLEATRRTAAGTEWLVRLANTVTWTFTGQNSWEMGNLINVTLTQPLLQGASRKVVLENLTQAERNFLAAVRQMVLFQQGHYARIATGSFTSPQSTSSPSGGTGASNVSNFPGVPTNGFYGLLAEQIRIQNRRQNIIGLEENLNRFLEMFDANQVTDVTQIEETRQNLLNAQSQLLTQVNSYQGTTEQYVRFLGLPPDLSIRISDPLLEQFRFTSPDLTVLMEDVAELLAMIRKNDTPLPENFRERTRDVTRRAGGEIIVLGQDLDILQKSMPERLRNLRNLEAALAERLTGGERIDIDSSIYSTETFEDRISKLRTRDIPQNLARLRASLIILDMFVNTEEQELREMLRNHSPQYPVFNEAVQNALETLNLNLAQNTDPQQQPEFAESANPLETVPESSDAKTPEEIRETARRAEVRRIIAELQQRDKYRDWVRQVFSIFQYELVSLSLMQTRTRLHSMTLVPVSMTAEEAFQTASERSLDWMNKRSQLVDVWRNIDMRADALKGVLDLSLTGQAGRVDSQGVRIRDTSNVEASLNWITPLNRHRQMMDYRSSQIAYQNARRNYYLYVDAVQADLRNIIRNLQTSRINFEINRNAVLIGTVRVDVMQLRMEQPVRGGRVDANAARDLISALDGLLTSQNNLLTTWVQYQTQRMLLDFGMGTMQLDDRGHWVDPGTIGSTAVHTFAPEVVPLPLPLDRIEIPKLNRRYIEEE